LLSRGKKNHIIKTEKKKALAFFLKIKRINGEQCIHSLRLQTEYYWGRRKNHYLVSNVIIGGRAMKKSRLSRPSEASIRKSLRDSGLYFRRTSTGNHGCAPSLAKGGEEGLLCLGAGKRGHWFYTSAQEGFKAAERRVRTGEWHRSATEDQADSAVSMHEGNGAQEGIDRNSREKRKRMGGG